MFSSLEVVARWEEMMFHFVNVFVVFLEKTIGHLPISGDLQGRVG